MSMYCDIKTQFKSREALVAALMEHGNWTRATIEVHDVPQHLVGYKGDVRQQVANVIIRRQFVPGASNDVGFVKQEDGTYQAIISEYDRSKYTDAWLGQLTASYAFHATKREMERRGRRVTRERLPNGHQRLYVDNYR